MRESSSGGKDDEDTPVCPTRPKKQNTEEKAQIRRHKEQTIQQRRERCDIHLQQEQTFF
jgi:hypothetical protein